MSSWLRLWRHFCSWHIFILLFCFDSFLFSHDAAVWISFVWLSNSGFAVWRFYLFIHHTYHDQFEFKVLCVSGYNHHPASCWVFFPPNFAGRVFSNMSAQGSALEGAEAVFQANQENNMPVRLRGANKNSMENQENVNVNKPVTRTVLGALTNNPRRQPAALRSSKQVSAVSVLRVVFLIPLYSLWSALSGASPLR